MVCPLLGEWCGVSYITNAVTGLTLQDDGTNYKLVAADGTEILRIRKSDKQVFFSAGFTTDEAY